MTFNVTVVGSGYVGSAMSVLLAKHHNVTVLDISQERVDKINDRKSHIEDKDIDEFLLDVDLNLTATTDKNVAYKSPDFVVVATPTDYDEKTNFFNTRTVESVIVDAVRLCPSAYIVIKSTIPIGFVNLMREKYAIENVAFSPEFLREGRALYDNLYPSRIIVGDDSVKAVQFAKMLAEASRTPQVSCLYMGAREAESVKLFANTYLAMRVAFFNELDTFAMKNYLIASDIIEGITLEPRIGTGYCNPSLGYGGYCFPKDTKQLRANFDGVPQSLIGAIIESNIVRKQAIIDEIVAKKPQVVGVYRLTMKSGSDNFRAAAVFDIMSEIKARGIDVQIYEPAVDTYQDYVVENDLETFALNCDLIVANRVCDEHRILFGKRLFSRGVFGAD
jgi:UDPglucose 6-dehydrogenase